MGWRLYGVLHKDSPFSITSGSGVVAQHQPRGIPSLYTDDLDPEELEDLQRALSDLLENESDHTGLILTSACYESAREQAKQLVKDGKKNVTLYKVYVPSPPRPRSTPVYLGKVANLAQSCMPGRHSDIDEDDYVFLGRIPAEYIDFAEPFN